MFSSTKYKQSFYTRLSAINLFYKSIIISQRTFCNNYSIILNKTSELPISPSESIIYIMFDISSSLTSLK